MSSFGEVLSEFKKAEEAENIVAIIEDHDLQNGMIAWKSVRITYKHPTDCQEKDPVAKWYWLWSQIDYNPTEFGIVSGSKAQNVGALLTRLRGLRLIYPDGTIHNLASQFLQSVIMSKLRAATPRAAKSSPAKNSSEKN